MAGARIPEFESHMPSHAVVSNRKSAKEKARPEGATAALADGRRREGKDCSGAGAAGGGLSGRGFAGINDTAPFSLVPLPTSIGW